MSHPGPHLRVSELALSMLFARADHCALSLQITAATEGGTVSTPDAIRSVASEHAADPVLRATLICAADPLPAWGAA